MRQVQVDHPWAGGERIGVPDAWHSEVIPCMWGLIMLLENHQPKARHDGDNIRVRWEALKWRRRGVIEELAWDVSKARWMCVCSMSLMMYQPKCPCVGLCYNSYSIVALRSLCLEGSVYRRSGWLGVAISLSSWEGVLFHFEVLLVRGREERVGSLLELLVIQDL
jgi:hypothetical protein